MSLGRRYIRKRMCIMVLAICGLLPLVSSGYSQTVERPMNVSIFQLLATPERFNGKLIAVVGFLTLGREADAISPYELDAVHLIELNAVAVDRTSDMEKSQVSLNRKYVKLIGIFKSANKQQLLVGSITRIVSCTVWSDPANPMSRRLKEIPGVGSSRQ